MSDYEFFHIGFENQSCSKNDGICIKLKRKETYYIFRSWVNTENSK